MTLTFNRDSICNDFDIDLADILTSTVTSSVTRKVDIPTSSPNPPYTLAYSGTNQIELFAPQDRNKNKHPKHVVSVEKGSLLIITGDAG